MDLSEVEPNLKARNGLMNILVVEDNMEVAELIRDTLLEVPGYNVRIFDPRRMTDDNWPVDFILLDEDLGGMSGLEFLEQFRARRDKWNGPVIMVTGKDDDEVIKKAFSHGIDDYVLKPFKGVVLKGKVQALSNRVGLGRQSIKAGPIEVDTTQHKISVNGEEVQLTLTEFKILKELVFNSGNLVTREDLRTRVFEGAYVTNRTIDVHICSLRKKLKDAGDPVKTVRGVGYRLIV